MVDIMLPLITCIFVVFDLASGGVAASWCLRILSTMRRDM